MDDPLTRAERFLDHHGLLDASGAVLYSAAETLKAGPLYLLGLNPGGSDGTTLRASIVASRRGQNEYVDAEWSPGGRERAAGQALMQRRVRALCASMGLDTREVPASNLVFTRSTRIKTHDGFVDATKLCLSVHDMFLEVIKPRFLMTFGSPGHFRQGFHLSDVEERPARHAAWKAFRGLVTRGGLTVPFGNVPHLAVWDSIGRFEVVEWALGRYERRIGCG